jgi:uncharacterized protein (TIGR02145 family)
LKNDKSMVTDIDGNEYKTIIIGEQEWFAENLRVSRYCNGDTIININNNETWKNTGNGAWSYYNNDELNDISYGKLYNYDAINDQRGLCPKGWRVPTTEDWTQLEMYLGIPIDEINKLGFRGNDKGGMLKDTGFSHWMHPNLGATNISGFSGRPGGVRLPSGEFVFLGKAGMWWTSGNDVPFCRGLYYEKTSIYNYHYFINYGFSVRCVKDTIVNINFDIFGKHWKSLEQLTNSSEINVNDLLNNAIEEYLKKKK